MHYLGTLGPNWPRKLSEDMVERRLFWAVRSIIGPVWPDDFGKRVYAVDDPAGSDKPMIVQVESNEQRDRRLEK